MIRYRHRLLFKSFYDNFINFKILTLYIYIHIGKNRQSRARPCSSLANTRYRTEFLRNLLNRYSEDSFRAHKICSLMYFSLLFFPVQHGTSYRTIIRYGYAYRIFWRRITYCVKITLLFFTFVETSVRYVTR